MLIDTCVWLDLAKDQKQAPLIGVAEQLVKLGLLTMLVPRTVLDEFRRNRERIAKESAKSLSSHFRLVKDAVGKIGGDKKRVKLVLSHLDNVDHKIPIVGGTAVNNLDRIEKLLESSRIIEPSEPVRLRAAQRGLKTKRPLSIEKRIRWRLRLSLKLTPSLYRQTKAQALDSRSSRTTRATFVSSTAIKTPARRFHRAFHLNQIALFH